MDSALFMPNEPNSGARDRSQGGAGEDGSGQADTLGPRWYGWPHSPNKKADSESYRRVSTACTRKSGG